MKLIVGAESTWSLRALVCGYLSGVDFDVEEIDLSSSGYKEHILKRSPAGLVPILVTESSTVHDSLAIAEFFNEITDGSLYPGDRNLRAVSRSLCAELHSGFQGLRETCPFSLAKVKPLTDLSADVLHEISRIEEIFSQATLPYMFEKAGAVDAFYSVMAYRLKIYGINLSGSAGKYQQSLIEWPVLLKAINALNTKD